MTSRCSGNRLMAIGLIVTLIGLTVALARTLQVPGEWTTALVGIALVAAGAVRTAINGRREAPGGKTE
jgi:tetrahydromethanopterin S-methyltransferase subunit C